MIEFLLSVQESIAHIDIDLSSICGQAACSLTVKEVKGQKEERHCLVNAGESHFLLETLIYRLMVFDTPILVVVVADWKVNGMQFGTSNLESAIVICEYK